MMHTTMYWVDGPWPGQLAIMPRPRGGDWLPGEIEAWRHSGVDVAVSLLTAEEAAEFELGQEEVLCRVSGIQFCSFPIPDRGIPSSMEMFSSLISTLAERLAEGKTVAVHCRQGIGRAGLVAVGLLVHSHMDPRLAIQQVSAVRGCGVPETPEQVAWIGDFAKSLLAPAPA